MLPWLIVKLHGYSVSAVVADVVASIEEEAPYIYVPGGS